MTPRLFIVIPCYNEQEVLPITAPMFLEKLNSLAAASKISSDSRVLFVNDGSKDNTWSIIQELSKTDEHYIGISQSRNRGHQNAVLAGLMEAKDKCDITISIDCDGQDDINAMDAMVDAYLDGCEVVYGVRSSRETDTFFKRFTAQSFYKFLAMMGAEVVYNREPLSAQEDDRPRGRRHHEPFGKAAPVHHGLRHHCCANKLYRLPLGAHHGAVRQSRRGLGKHDLHCLLCQRCAAYLPRHHRRVHRENLHGDQAPPALYNQRAYLEKIGRIKNGRAANTLRHA